MKKLIFVFALLFSVSCSQKKTELNKYFEANNIQLKLSDSFELKNISSLQPVIRAEDSSNHRIIKISVKSLADKNSIEEEVKKAILLVATQYEFTMAPYPGQITEATNCGHQFRPVIVKNNNLSFLKLFSNSRLALSICDSDGYTYKTAMAFYKNPSASQLLIVEYFYQADKPETPEDFLKQNFKNYQNIDISVSTYKTQLEPGQL